LSANESLPGIAAVWGVIREMTFGPCPGCDVQDRLADGSVCKADRGGRQERAMQTDPSVSSSGPIQVGAVAALWRYPVKSMMGEELNSCEVTGRGLLGDRQFAVVDRATGKVGGAKNPRKWGDFFDFRAAYAQPPQAAATMPAVRITLPDGTMVDTGHGDLERVLSRAFGRDVALEEAQPGEGSPGATAEEYWPDMAGLDYRDTVTDFDMPAGTFFDIAVVHLLTTATIDHLQGLYPPGRFEARRFRPNPGFSRSLMAERRA
jgi:uncharacterized protein